MWKQLTQEEVAALPIGTELRFDGNGQKEGERVKTLDGYKYCIGEMYTIGTDRSCEQDTGPLAVGGWAPNLDKNQGPNFKFSLWAEEKEEAEQIQAYPKGLLEQYEDILQEIESLESELVLLKQKRDFIKGDIESKIKHLGLHPME